MKTIVANLGGVGSVVVYPRIGAVGILQGSSEDFLRIEWVSTPPEMKLAMYVPPGCIEKADPVTALGTIKTRE